jgi:hypothetical protein
VSVNDSGVCAWNSESGAYVLSSGAVWMTAIAMVSVVN